MGTTVGETNKQPTVRLSELAALKLKMLLLDEPDAERLCYRVVPATTGCGSSSFRVTLTEQKEGEHLFVVREIPFSYSEDDLPFLNGLTIELNRQSGKLELSNPTFMPDQDNCCTEK